MKVTILPLTYMGNVEYFSLLLRGDCVIDICENFVKQTYRSRCDIMSANGLITLSVNVCGGSSMVKTAMKDMRIDNTLRWQHRHRLALVSAYRNSPYFDHYWDDILPFYEKKYEFLVDFNGGMLHTLLGLLKAGPIPAFSENYVTASGGDADMRPCFPRKKREFGASGLPANTYCPDNIEFSPYYQVFSEKHPFAPNLSVVDLLFCEGPHALAMLKQPLRKGLP